MRPIKDISPYFKVVGDSWVFTGKKLELFIPEIYTQKELLTVGDHANSLGIFKMVFNDQLYANFLLLAKISIEFTNYRKETVDGYDYIVLELVRDQKFIRNRFIPKNSNLIYDVFMMMIAYGNIPAFLDYNAVSSLFDNDKRCCGLNLGVNHTIWEVIYAHLHRDQKDRYQYYRLTPMTKPPTVVPLHAISHSPRSTTAKLVGSYMTDGMISSLVDEPKEPSVVENLLRS